MFQMWMFHGKESHVQENQLSRRKMEGDYMKTVLIGASDIYDWSKVKNWIKSARQTGFGGDIVLLTYRITNPQEFLANCERYNVNVFSIEHDAFGNPIQHTAGGRDTQCHQLRFFHAWQFLHDNHDQYDNVIMTDVRDVIFQKNPQEYLQQYINEDLIISSESITFGNEPWNANNMVLGFGPFFREISIDWTVYNVGVLAGKSVVLKNLFLTIYNSTVGRYIPSDQSSFNILLREGILGNHLAHTDHANDWACQCGTTLDPEKIHYRTRLTDPVPEIKDGIVYNTAGQPFHIVHQYDRVPELSSYIERLYA